MAMGGMGMGLNDPHDPMGMNDPNDPTGQMAQMYGMQSPMGGNDPNDPWGNMQDPRMQRMMMMRSGGGPGGRMATGQNDPNDPTAQMYRMGGNDPNDPFGGMGFGGVAVAVAAVVETVPLIRIGAALLCDAMLEELGCLLRHGLSLLAFLPSVVLLVL